jgi:phage tail-like protein
VRLGIDGLQSRYPLSLFLPAMLQDDDFAMRWVAALDEVLAPVLWTLDSLDAYLDPRTAPLDVVDWLGSWVGAEVDEGLPAETRRALVAEAAELHGRRGTVAGLVRLLELTTDVEVIEVDDGRSVTWSQDPTAAINGIDGRPTLRVRVRGEEAAVRRVREVAAAWCPAHVPIRVEVEDP